MQDQRETLPLQDLVADPSARVHFVGIAGSGMSALADYRLLAGGRVSGSDRFFDQGRELTEAARLRALGATLHPQDGRGAEEADLLVASTAVEARIPDLQRALELGRPLAHRADWLAAHLVDRPSIAIAGTSGKSTTVGMCFAALRAAGLDPGLITGGDLNEIRSERVRGNGWYGRGPLVIEADESDKSLVRYHPGLGLVLNLHLDHDEPAAILPVFRRFLDQCRGPRLIAEDEELAALRPGAEIFGLGPDADHRAEAIVEGRDGSCFRYRGHPIELPIPGRHNLLNALAALAIAGRAGADLELAAAGLARYRGVARRFEILGRPRGIEVIDDYAHNPAKIEAALRTARARGDRLIAVFQPHGFGPTRFMRQDYVAAIQRVLRPEDQFWFLEIFYAGGTVTRDISARELAEELQTLGVQGRFAAERADLVAALRAEARPGDTILIMGARDPSLPLLGRSLIAALD